MAITATLVKELREKTNVGMMECKKALTETQGDIDAAIKLLRERGIAKADKRANREATEGLVVTAINETNDRGVLIELNCETDFVAKNDQFQTFANDLAQTLLASEAKDLESALNLPKEESTLGDLIKAKVLEVGENLQLSQYTSFQVEHGQTGAVGSYIHLGRKIGVLVELNCQKPETSTQPSFQDTLKDLSLHIAATNPQGLNREDIPADLIESEKDIFRKQLLDQGKPENIIDKILVGKLDKFYSENCLLEQGFIKEPDQKITDWLTLQAKDLGETFSIKQFQRFQVGS